MNWYADELIIRSTLAERQSERDMDRLARAAQGETEGIGVEDVFSARAFVNSIIVRGERGAHAAIRPTLKPAPAGR